MMYFIEGKRIRILLPIIFNQQPKLDAFLTYRISSYTTGVGKSSLKPMARLNKSLQEEVSEYRVEVVTDFLISFEQLVFIKSCILKKMYFISIQWLKMHKVA